MVLQLQIMLLSVLLYSVETHGCASFCSGTLIAPRYLLTAAHCVEGLRSSGEYYFVFGSSIGSVFAYGEVLDWIEHEEYSGMNSQYISDDIAVVEINGVYDINTQEKIRYSTHFLES